MKNWLYNLTPVILLFSLVFGLSGCGDGTSEIEEWKQYRLNSQNNPVSNITGLSEYPKILITDDEIRATPVVVDSRLFVGNHGSGSLNAFSLETGKQLWKNSVPNWVHSEMVFSDESVFVGYGNRFFRILKVLECGEQVKVESWRSMPIRERNYGITKLLVRLCRHR